MTDPYCIDAHKLNLHPARVQQWLDAAGDWEKAKKVTPIYVEIAPAGGCNHRCVFCALDYVGYRARALEAGLLKERLTEMASCGVRSVMFGGEGEPLLHKQLAGIVAHAKKAGLDCALTTNAVLMTSEFLDQALGSLSWIKASIDAGTPETYLKIHRAQAGDFEKVLDNMARAAERRSREGLKVVLGAQMLLLPDNASEAVALARRVRELGLDYLAVKPYSQHPKSLTKRYEDVRYGDFLDLADELEALETRDFRVVFRRHAMEKWDDPERHYAKCHATPNFWAYIMATGDLYGCSAYLLDERFNYGNIHSQGFAEIWEGPRRRENWAFVREGLDITECRRNCRMDEVNRYLWALKHPPAHVNFI
jgi:GTP 3',8-cyclase